MIQQYLDCKDSLFEAGRAKASLAVFLTVSFLRYAMVRIEFEAGTPKC
jgi:hypothetical protein